ncbi:hypothetical protein PATA110616_18455 [Paenibacillus tarimensis]
MRLACADYPGKGYNTLEEVNTRTAQYRENLINVFH